ncbi:MAG: cystathionine gamma-synthase [Elusimicrobia bacterium]|nr:cystathionine gamma-synthase [Elusimicrobiota bacterium]
MAPEFSTIAIHAGQEPEAATGAVNVPVYLTSTYAQQAPGKHKGYDYSRASHPTRAALEKNLAALENARDGICFASGLAAEDAVLHLLGPGDHVISCRDLYGGSYRLFRQVFEKFGLSFSFVEPNLRAIQRTLTRRTRMIWIETPSNPLLYLTDIQAVAEVARKRRILLVADNTFATPYLQRPLDCGAAVVVHSVTKYLGGHSDVVGGAVLTSRPEVAERVRFHQKAVGAVPGPLDCYLVLRGVKTLAVRMERHCANAGEIAEFLLRHPKVRKVYYPGLPDHPGHEVARKQMRDFGGMVSFELQGGAAGARRFFSAIRLWTLAESLGGVESLICHPVTMTHASIPRKERLRNGLTEGLIRLSVGIEDASDLTQDLQQAIAFACRS